MLYNITCLNLHFKWNFYIYDTLFLSEGTGDDNHPRELTKKKNEIVHLKIKIYSHYFYSITTKPDWALPPPNV